MAKTTKDIFGNKSLRRNQFDQALGGRLNVSARRGISGDPLTTGVNMAQQDLNNAVNIRNEHDDDAELFSNLGKIAGDKPEGAAALFTGLMEGASYGAKTKSTAKKQEALDKYDRVTDYFRKINAQAAEMKEWYQKREFAQQKYMPQVLAYAENIDKLDTQSQRLMAQSILDGWNRTTGDEYKLDTIDGSDPFVMTVSSKDGTQVIDVRDLFAGDEVLQQRLAMKTPEYQMKLQEERQQKAKEFSLKEDEFELKKFEKGAPSKYSQKGEGQGQEDEILTFGDHSYKVGSLKATEKNARAEYQKKVYKEIDAIPKNNQALKAIETMREVFDRNPNIGTSMINMLDNPDGVDSWMNIFGRKLAGQDLTDMEILRKATNDLNLDTILGISGKAATDLLKKAVQAASPSGKITKGGFDAVSAKWEAKAREANELAQAKYEAMQQGKSLVPTIYKGKSSQASTKSQDEWSNLGAPAQ